MTNKHQKTRQGPRKLSCRLVLVLLLICLALHLWLAGRRIPTWPTLGQDIHWSVHYQTGDPNRFRVATYNIHRGKGTDDVRDLERTADVLKDCDIVALNEVAGPSVLSGTDQAQELGKQLGIGWLFACNQRQWYRDVFGNGLLSRFQVTHWFNEPLVYDPDQSHSPRNLLTAHIQVGSHTIPVLITHLDRGPMAEHQLRHVLWIFTQYPVAILLGDFNKDITDTQMLTLFQDPFNVDAAAQALGPADQEKRIDWIITRGCKVLGGQIHPVGVSDHPCLKVDLAIEKEKLVIGNW